MLHIRLFFVNAKSSLSTPKERQLCNIKNGVVKWKSPRRPCPIRMLLGGLWLWLCSSPLSVSYLFLKFFELWSRFLRNDLKRKNVLLLAAKPAGLRGACWRITTLEAEKWPSQLASVWNRCRKDRALLKFIGFRSFSEIEKYSTVRACFVNRKSWPG